MYSEGSYKRVVGFFVASENAGPRAITINVSTRVLSNCEATRGSTKLMDFEKHFQDKNVKKTMPARLWKHRLLFDYLYIYKSHSIVVAPRKGK